MTHRRVVADSLEYDFAPDTPPLLAQRDWAMFSAQLLDDIRGEPLRTTYMVRVVLPGARDEQRQDGSWARRAEQGVLVKRGAEGTFALVTRPWVRFPPLALPASITVSIEAPGFLPLQHTFAVAYDTRTIAAPPPLVDAQVVTLNSTLGLVAGQTLLFGPIATPQYVRITNLAAGNQVLLEGGLPQPQALGDPVFPDGYAFPPPAVLTLRRAPVRIFGRVVTRDTTANVSTAVVGATVTVSDFWRSSAAVAANPNQGAMTDPNPALREFVVAVAPGTLVARAAGASAGAVGLPAVAGDDRLLSEPAVVATSRLDVAREQNLIAPPAPLANRLVAVEPGDPDIAEYQTITTVQPSGTAAEPAELGLSFPLRHDHREGSRVSRINAPGVLPAAPRVLRDAAVAGDRCVFLDSLATLPLRGTLRLTGGSSADEFQSYSQLSAVSNAEGYYWLPPVQRTARLAVTVDDGGGNVQTVEVDPEYPETEQRLDFVYPI